MDGGAPLDMWTVEIDGVRGIWVPTDGPLSVALMFGVGFNDEPMPKRGINHLIEHLSLFGLDHRHLDFNGHTTPTTTAFTASGTVEDVQIVLDHACRSLHRLPADRIDQECRVLRTEAQRRGRSVLGGHLAMRYGNRGAGLLDAEELGLRWLQAADLAEWIHTSFTSGNAVLAAAGPDPRALRLDLPQGLAPQRARTPRSLITRPSIEDLRTSGIALSTTGPIDPAWSLAFHVLGEVAQHRLRTVDARAYAIDQTSVDVGPDEVVRYLAADCLPEEAEAVRSALSSELAKLAQRGPTAEELADAKAGIPKGFTDPKAAMSHAYMAAEAILAGRPVRTLAASLQRVLDVSADDIAAALDQASDQILWTIPTGVDFRDFRYAPVPQWSEHRIDGTAYQRGANDVLAPERAEDRLVVSDEGIMLLLADQAVTVRWADLTAACRYTDRTWTFSGADGFGVTFRARDWFGGNVIDASLAEFLPSDQVVVMGEPHSPDSPDVDPQAPFVPAAPPPPPDERKGRRMPFRRG